MKKLVYEFAGAGGFEMPVLRKVNLEKENSLVLATPKTVYRGNTSGFSSGVLMNAAKEDLQTGGQTS